MPRYLRVVLMRVPYRRLAGSCKVASESCKAALCHNVARIRVGGTGIVQGLVGHRRKG